MIRSIRNDIVPFHMNSSYRTIAIDIIPISDVYRADVTNPSTLVVEKYPVIKIFTYLNISFKMWFCFVCIIAPGLHCY